MNDSSVNSGLPVHSALIRFDGLASSPQSTDTVYVPSPFSVMMISPDLRGARGSIMFPCESSL